MKLNAYILAADPAWIEASVLSYYGMVDKIVVSYDENSTSWTGTPIPVEECLARLRAIDKDQKMVYSPGHYARLDHQPMENDTYQRQCALDEAGKGADWVLQLDTDEVLPSPDRLADLLRECGEQGIPALEWPMRVLFRKFGRGDFLEVCAKSGRNRYEYPGPIAVRPGARLVDARRPSGRFLRATVHGDDESPQLRQAERDGESRISLLREGEAILHNSWARDRLSVHRKIGSWSHSAGLRSTLYYYLVWLPSPVTWRFLRNFHPFARGLWPRLRPLRNLPPATMILVQRSPI